MTPAKRILFSVLTILFLLSACAPAPAPTQDPAEIQRQIAESVALTVAAQNAQTEAAQPVVPEATNTPLPTQTEAVPPSPTPIVPSATPFVIVPPTLAPSGGGSGGVVIRPEYACDAANREPRDNTVFRAGYAFNIQWTIINTGTKTMRKGLDLKYFSGPQLTSTTLIELPELEPGDRYQVTLGAVTPSTYGFYVMTWVVEGELCYPYVAFYVE